MIGYLVLAAIVIAVLKGIYFPDTNSTSYRLGRGMGSKARKAGEWLMKDD